ncbi:hypothetical protein PLICRDRAFT_33568 [Plicaturopsis crispa FD-325 SS-3]|nr:hypothetical protein PLICRDRAFT_33568 [Plicaturopsis crispa FD-325 SS-3]
MSQTAELSLILKAGAHLTDSGRSDQVNASLKDVLTSRLAQYHRLLGHKDAVQPTELQDAQFQTACAALEVVETVQEALDVDEHSSEQGAPADSRGGVVPAIGTRDLATLRILLSIVFKWGVEPLLSRVISAWPSKPARTAPPGAKIIDLTTAPDDYRQLSSIVVRVIGLLLPRGTQGTMPQTLITATMLNRHMADLFRPAIPLGWLPRPLSSEAMPTQDSIRPLILRLLSVLPPSQTIASLGNVMSGTPSLPPFAQKACAALLSKQLLRPEGVRGLCAAVFGEDASSEDDAPLEKLEHVARVLTTVPAGMQNKEYFTFMIPKILAVLREKTAPPAHIRAAAFSVARLLASEKNTSDQACGIVLSTLHDPLLRVATHPLRDSESKNAVRDTAADSLSLLTKLITNTDPSPSFITVLLSPIVAELYSLLAHLDSNKTADPSLKETVRGLLVTWGRVVTSKEGVRSLWGIIDGEGGDWRVDMSGEITRVEKTDFGQSPLTMFTPEDLRRAEENGELDPSSNLLDLRPNPDHFVQFLKSINRADVSSDIFVTLLEGYREMRYSSDVDPMRTMLYLQLIIQMQTHLAEGNASSNILSKPEHILSFVKHALQSAATSSPQDDHRENTKNGHGLKMEDLRIVPEDDTDELDDGDSDDEAPESGGAAVDNEMIDTAINLLLSVLEANLELSAQTAPALNDIFSLLEPIANDVSHPARIVAREARMVITARMASASAPRSSSKKSAKSEEDEDVHETYQRALKLLQDPILPVRAHGLLLLRQLVSAKPSPGSNKPVLDSALVPAILSIFSQAIQDDDSYMFLNAVQGLVAMVDTFGSNVLKNLVSVYSQGLAGIGSLALTQQDVDMRVRVGEALGKVIRRCGNALSIYVDILVPPLFAVVRSSNVPTTLRTSALSLLAECVHTNALALLPYTTELFGAMIDLLQIETVPSARDAPKQNEEEAPPSMDSQPTSTNSKFPPLRRAALHFLTLLLRTCIAQAYETSAPPMFSDGSADRAKTTLTYVAATDADDVVRVMAREAAEELEDLHRAMLGL